MRKNVSGWNSLKIHGRNSKENLLKKTIITMMDETFQEIEITININKTTEVQSQVSNAVQKTL